MEDIARSVIAYDEVFDVVVVGYGFAGSVSEDGSEVRGTTVEGQDGIRRIEARRGVILASGGFEGSAEQQDQF